MYLKKVNYVNIGSIKLLVKIKLYRFLLDVKFKERLKGNSSNVVVE